MHPEATNEISRTRNTKRMLDILDQSIRSTTATQNDLLKNQSASLEAISRLLNMPAYQAEQASLESFLFTRQQLEEFAVGSITRCFGPDYRILDERPTPRIPNGRLLLVDRVRGIAGRRMEINPPASIISEVDVRPDAWFLKANPFDGVPLAILMEMALQPCGILSAYLGTSLVIPAQNHLFRNLDGWISQTSNPNLAGKTIVNQAELTKSITSGGLYIQSYRFQLSVQNQVFLEGETSFGYFTQAVMNKQSGLDLGEKRPMLMQAPDFPAGYTQIREKNQEPVSLLDLTGETWLNPGGGRHGMGAAIGKRRVDKEDWFFSNHFHGDPVMPGSLGVEAMMRGLANLAGNTVENKKAPSIELDLSKEEPLRWKYRGQVIPGNQNTYFETHIKEMKSKGGKTRVSADADFWVDGLRIYSVENLSILLR